jgi:hypothetical protein
MRALAHNARQLTALVLRRKIRSAIICSDYTHVTRHPSNILLVSGANQRPEIIWYVGEK